MRRTATSNGLVKAATDATFHARMLDPLALEFVVCKMAT